MKKGSLIALLILCLLLTGCAGWMNGSYVSVTPREAQSSGVQSGKVSASNYTQLLEVLTQMVDSGAESAVINVADYDQDSLESGLFAAAHYLRKAYPLGAYSIEEVRHEIGTNSGKPAVSVNISYIHGRSEIRKIQHVQDMDGVRQKIVQALEKCDASVVIHVADYRKMDVVQLVEDYALDYPDVVMEIPQVSVGMYPESGAERIMELNFTYQTSREVLRQMQNQVDPYFASASLYVSGDGTEGRKYAQLFAFLMERYDYKIETSLTPAYSLLCHGVGDSEAFASVYARMCRRAGLDCQVVSGTRAGEPWFWNMICDNGVYYHVDLLQCNSVGAFMELQDEGMEGYVWDYSAYSSALRPDKNF